MHAARNKVAALISLPVDVWKYIQLLGNGRYVLYIVHMGVNDMRDWIYMHGSTKLNFVVIINQK